MSKKLVLPIAYYVSYIIMFVGLLVFIFGLVVLGKGIYNKNNTLPIEAKVMTIIENDEERYIMISYTIKEETYVNELPYFDASLDIGSYVTVHYFKNDPSKISGSVNYQLQSFLMICIGLIIILIKTVYFVKYFKEVKRINLLLKKNRYVELEIICVEEIEKDISYGVVPKVIICEHNGKEYKSSYIWENGNLSAYVGHKVKMYYEDSTFNNYFINYLEVK